jgi:hypothetical protein
MKADEKELAARIVAILYDVDPMGIGSGIYNPNESEYDLEVEDIIGASEESLDEREFANKVVAIFDHWFGGDLERQEIERVKEAAAKIYKLK